jgi:SAM-dependent methyltransferase
MTVFEALLLLVVLAVMRVSGASSVPFLTLFTIVFILCLPLLRLAIMRAPPYIPTPLRRVRTMMALAALRPGEKVYDLGCGDGRVLRAAVRRGAIAVGYELSLPTYLVAKLLCLFRRNASVRFGNFWKHDYRDADVIFCFLLIDTMQEFKKKIWPTLKPGTRVVSYVFQMLDEPVKKKDGSVYLYVK